MGEPHLAVTRGEIRGVQTANAFEMLAQGAGHRLRKHRARGLSVPCHRARRSGERLSRGLLRADGAPPSGAGRRRRGARRRGDAVLPAHRGRSEPHRGSAPPEAASAFVRARSPPTRGADRRPARPAALVAQGSATIFARAFCRADSWRPSRSDTSFRGRG